MYSHPTSKVTYQSVLMIFWYFIKCTKISLFHWKLWRNLESLEGCKNSPRLHNDTCNTAFESLNVILLNMIIFGYHSGTQNSTYVRHSKWGWLGRGHFKLYGIRQQVLTITSIMKKSALPSSFRKYLTPRSYLASLAIYLQIHLY